MTDSISWDKIRKDFKITNNYAYFHSAGMSPIPKPVFRAITRAYERLYEAGDIDFHHDLEQAEMLLQQVGHILNTSSTNLALLPNTSMALSMVALSMQRFLHKPFSILSKADEFPATHIPFEYQDIPVKYVAPENGRYPVERILDQVNESTRAVVCSYVQYNTGFRQDLETLGTALRERDLLFVVNATQGFPFFHLDMEKMHIDVMVASLHKWGCAGHVGSLMYTSEAYRERFPAPLAGWLSVRPPEGEYILTSKGAPFHIHPHAAQYQFGTSNLQSVLGLKAAISYMEEIGIENIRKRILELITETIASLSQLENVEIMSPHNHAGEQSGILSINLKGKNNEACVSHLESKHIITAMRDGHIRISCNFFNNREDIDLLTEEIRNFMKS
ncbi:MAG: aminotransferase class V-fold PLP-dependent enzyme [Bacteroidales bacterium]